jgi:hypothetical protein
MPHLPKGHLPILNGIKRQIGISRMRLVRRSVPVLWLLVLITAIVMAVTIPSAGDAKVYENTVKEVQSSISPYVAGIARLQLNHARSSRDRTMNYIYPPITLPLVRAIGLPPAWLRVSAFCLLYLASAWLLLRTQENFIEQDERKFLLWVSPLCVFFPGLLNDDFFLAGNIAPILYGLICAAAIWDWKHRQWKWFYLAVLFAFVFKAPMLTLLAIPVLTRAGEWLKVAITGFVACALLLLQGWIWPGPMNTYLRMMDMEFVYNRQFGFGPTGCLGRALLDPGLPYLGPCAVFYLFSSLAIFLLLHTYAQHYQAGRLTMREWMPVLLIGVILLSPRIKQYDAEAVTLPLAIVAWRVLMDRKSGKKQAVALGIALLAVGNVLALAANSWDFIEMLLMVTLFGHSVWKLRQKAACAEEGAMAIPALQEA